MSIFESLPFIFVRLKTAFSGKLSLALVLIAGYFFDSSLPVERLVSYKEFSQFDRSLMTSIHKCKEKS